MCKNLSFKVSKLSPLRNLVPKNILNQIYNSVIQPAFDYAISIWGNTTLTNLSKVQRIQNRAARILTGNFDYVNYRGVDIVHALGWMDVGQRCSYFRNMLNV